MRLLRAGTVSSPADRRAALGQMPLDTRRLGANLIDSPTAMKADAMATPVKKTRRTAERILDVTLELFNRFGEPNVSTTLISAELHISTRSEERRVGKECW